MGGQRLEKDYGDTQRIKTSKRISDKRLYIRGALALFKERIIKAPLEYVAGQPRAFSTEGSI